ncbi:MAG: thiaminase II [Alphaproteobacteria bacterium]
MINFAILMNNCAKQWYEYTNHEFVEKLKLGTLPIKNFQHYLCQDYLFLMEYSKAWEYAVHNAKNISEREFAYKNLRDLLDGEIELHISYCADWNISKEQVFATKQHANNKAYTDYVIDFGKNGSYIDMITALAPCAIGYAEIGKRIITDKNTNKENNPYKSWIDVYCSNEFIQKGEEFKSFMSKVYDGISQDEIEKQKHIFKKATELEIGFWDMGMEK